MNSALVATFKELKSPFDVFYYLFPFCRLQIAEAPLGISEIRGAGVKRKERGGNDAPHAWMHAHTHTHTHTHTHPSATHTHTTQHNTHTHTHTHIYTDKPR